MVRATNINISLSAVADIEVKFAIPNVITFRIDIITNVFTYLYKLATIALRCLFPIINYFCECIIISYLGHYIRAKKS